MARQHPGERGELQEQNGRAEVCPKPNTSAGERAANRLDYRLGIETICSVLGVSKRTAYGMLEDGRLPGKKLGNRWLVSETEIREFIARLPGNDAQPPSAV